MLKKTLLRPTLFAVGLVLVHELINFLARQLYRQPTGTRPGDIQKYNNMIANYAGWVFTFILAGVWIFMYLRNRQSGNRQLCIQIAATFGIFSLIDMIKNIVAALLSSEMPRILSTDIAPFTMFAPLSFIMSSIKTGVLTGLMAAAVIALINWRRPVVDESLGDRTMSSSHLVHHKIPNELLVGRLSGETTHPQSSDIGSNCGSDLFGICLF